MEGVLKKICTQCKVKGNLFQKDWDALPLPCLPREGIDLTPFLLFII
jgi:hypothetical protein